MALSKENKLAVVAEMVQLLLNSKMTVMAIYPGTSVKAMQALRRLAKEDGTQIKIVKNRLFKKALQDSNSFTGINTDIFRGQLMYAFNPKDEVAPAKNLADFAKDQPQIKFVGALTQDGQLLSAAEVQILAALPRKDQLRAQLVAVVEGPLGGFLNVAIGNMRGFSQVMNARAKQLRPGAS